KCKCGGAFRSAVDIGIPDGRRINRVGVVQHIVQRNQPAHGMSEKDDRQTRMIFMNMLVKRSYILDGHKMALLLCDHSPWRMSTDIGAMPTMVVDIDVVAR